MTLISQVDQTHQTMKNIMTSLDVRENKPVKVVTSASEVGYVYCARAHLFEECSENPASVNYVSNDKYNNP